MIQEIMERREIEGIWEAFYLLSNHHNSEKKQGTKHKTKQEPPRNKMYGYIINKNKGHHHWQNKSSQEIIERLAWLFGELGGGRDPRGYAIYRKA